MIMKCVDTNWRFINILVRRTSASKVIEERRLDWMLLPVSWLPLTEVRGVAEVWLLACQHESFEHLGDCQQVRYLSVVGRQQSVEPAFFSSNCWPCLYSNLQPEYELPSVTRFCQLRKFGKLELGHRPPQPSTNKTFCMGFKFLLVATRALDLTFLALLISEI